MTEKKMTKKTSDKHICSECIEDFDAKDIYTAKVPEREYYTAYCIKCLKKLKITEYKPYLKERKGKNSKK